jgi:hypothetical protein
VRYIEPQSSSFKPNTRPAGELPTQSAIKMLAAFTAVAALGLAGCKSRPLPPPAPGAPTAATPTPAPAAIAAVGAPRSMVEYRRQAAHRIVAANAANAGSGPLQQPSFGIASVTVRLNADGSIRGVGLFRASEVSPSVNQMAMDAARRVGNYGPVGHLPQPWEFNETFFYDDAKKFQLITIVESR